jgi:type I restriction enzyme S subunit
VSTAQLWAAVSPDEIGSQLAATSTGTSASHQRVNEQTVLCTTIPDPRALSESQRDEVDQYLSTYLSIGRERSDLIAARDFLLPRLVSGELRVEAAEDLVEDVA